MSYSNLVLNSIFLFSLLICFAVSASFNNTRIKCSHEQTLSLFHFKQSLSSFNYSYEDPPFPSPCRVWLGSEGYYPIMMNWNTSTDCCDWDGVTCDRSTGDVIGLDLSCGMLQGTLHPNSSLFNLPHLRRLNLANNDFADSQFPHEIGRFSDTLTHLNISDSRFIGQIPANITLFRKLMSLDLSSNYRFLFRLDPQVFINLLRNCSTLEELSLQGVNITSVLPSYLNISSSSLKLLNLGATGLEGELPYNFFKLRSLEKLDLWNFTGQIPWEISLLPNLVHLDLSSDLDLQIQPHIFNGLLQNSTLLRFLSLQGVHIGSGLPTYVNISYLLNYLDLSSCSLMGPLPRSLGNLRHLTSLVLSSNRLNGTLPSWLFNLSSLEYIFLGDNMFSGQVPFELFSLQSLKYLHLGQNQLSGQFDVLDQGPIMQTFQQLTNLAVLDLSFNNFRGVWNLDTLLLSLKNLVYLYISHSGFSVTTNNSNLPVDRDFFQLGLGSCKLTLFPVSLRSMKNLRVLDLADNDIQGQIPDWIGEIGRDGLLLLDLSNNSLTGTIPNVYEDFGGLQGIILNGNELQGEVPSSLSKCEYLMVVDLGNNHLNGTFPSWLGDLPNLQALVLKSNNFHGPILTSSTLEFSFPSLQVLDLSYNGFEGQLPTNYFQNFNAMKNVVTTSKKPKYIDLATDRYYSIVIAVKGAELGIPKLLVDYTIVDLSNNNFEREIPNVIGNLNSLKVLNLSHNRLTGGIPNALGKLSKIESLDLSWNQLSGSIPRNLADITSLAVLNLSQNNLAGSIPKGNQFNTFDEYSFGGNSGLCGFPLPKQCENSNFPRLGGDRSDEKDESGFTWNVVMMGYGCGTGVGLVMGYLMLSTRRLKWFNAIVDAGEHMILKRRKKRRYILYTGK